MTIVRAEPLLLINLNNTVEEVTGWLTKPPGPA